MLTSLYGGIPFVSSRSDILARALKLSDLKNNELYYELGSGIGSGLLIASERFKARAVGVEISPFHWLISRLRTWRNKNIQVIMADFRKIDLSNADVIYCYLSPKLMRELLPKFKRELKKGSRVISYAFRLHGIKADALQKEKDDEVYLYSF